MDVDTNDPLSCWSRVLRPGVSGPDPRRNRLSRSCLTSNINVISNRTLRSRTVSPKKFYYKSKMNPCSINLSKTLLTLSRFNFFFSVVMKEQWFSTIAYLDARRLNLDLVLFYRNFLLIKSLSSYSRVPGRHTSERPYRGRRVTHLNTWGGREETPLTSTETRRPSRIPTPSLT